MWKVFVSKQDKEPIPGQVLEVSGKSGIAVQVTVQKVEGRDSWGDYVVTPQYIYFRSRNNTFKSLDPYGGLVWLDSQGNELPDEYGTGWGWE